MMTAGELSPVGGWSDEDQVAWYIERIGKVEARQAGERALLELLPTRPRRALDLGCGDGRLTALVLADRPSLAEAVAIDRSPPMLERAEARFAADPKIRVLPWDLNQAITPFGQFDLIISGFAIHHLEDDRKQSLFVEVAAQLAPGGAFINLEVVKSETPELHKAFLAAIGRTADDPEDRLASIEEQLRWMGAAGLDNVECVWRWRGFALMVGMNSEVA